MADYSVLSNFGVRYFLADVADVFSSGVLKSSVLLTAGEEITDVLSCDVGEISKEVKTFKTLNGDGWDSAVPLGQSVSEGNMSLIRTGTGQYSSSGTTSYDRLRAWMESAAAAGGATAAKALVEVVPRGQDVNSGTGATGTHTIFDATAYIVTPTRFNPGERNTSDGQEYSISFQPYGKPQTQKAWDSLADGTKLTGAGVYLNSTIPTTQPS